MKRAADISITMDTSPTVPQLLQSLEDFAICLIDVLSDPDIDWQWRPAESEWSLSEVMCHMRDVEREVHLARYQAIISHENPFISGVASDEWAEARAYRVQNGREAAVDFFSLRQQSLEQLRKLDGEQWQRTGSHAYFGTTSLHELISLAVQHDQAHWQQIQELLAGPS
ncbi:MAG: DinB family protein [Candidatus Promineifilaceae bacterium]